MSDPRGPGDPGPPVRPEEVERRLRSTFALRAEDLAPGDRTGDPGPGLDPGSTASAGTVVALPTGPRHLPSPRRRLALVAAVAAVVLPLAVAAVALAGGDDGDPAPLPPAVPRPTACTSDAPRCEGTSTPGPAPETTDPGRQRGRPTTTVTTPLPEVATTAPSPPEPTPGETTTLPAPPATTTVPTPSTEPPAPPTTTTAVPPQRLSRSGG